MWRQNEGTVSRVAIVWSALGRPRLFTVAFGLGLALRVITMLAFPPAVWFGGDSASYLSTALRLVPGTSRLSGYGLMLLMLRPLHSFAAVTAVQHLLGLALGVMIYALLRRYGLPDWGATLAAVPVLFSAYQVQLEHEILPSAAFSFLVMSAITLTLWWPVAETPGAGLPPGAGRLAWPVVTAGLLLAVSATFWPVGGPLLVLLLIYLAVRRAGWRVLAATVAAAVLPLTGYLGWFDHTYHHLAFSNSDGVYLWSRTMTFADCAVIKPPPMEAGLCPRQPVGRRPAASTFIWEPGSPLNNLPGKKFSVAKNALAMNFALRAIAAQPAGYLTAVLHDAALSFTWNIANHPSALMTRRYEFAYATRHWIAPGYVVVPGHTVAADELAYGGATSTRAVAPFAGWLIGYQRFVYLRGTLLAAILLIGLGGVARAWRGGRRAFAGRGGGVRASRARGGGAGASRARGGPGLLPWLASVTLLLVPVMTADYSERYVLIAAPAACLAAGLAFARTAPGERPGSPAAADSRPSQATPEPTSQAPRPAVG
jgi:hypothetical protein